MICNEAGGDACEISLKYIVEINDAQTQQTRKRPTVSLMRVMYYMYAFMYDIYINLVLRARVCIPG